VGRKCQIREYWIVEHRSRQRQRRHALFLYNSDSDRETREAEMIPLFVLVAGFVLFLLLGHTGVHYFQESQHALRAALGIMFCLTASAHWGKRRPDLIAMVPPSFPRVPLLVTLTGIAEIAGAIALQIPSFALFAAMGLFLMLLAIFPANVFAARNRLSIGGRSVPALLPRTLIQLIFLAALWFAAFPRS
jgi:uncharacterized membrane protein